MWQYCGICRKDVDELANHYDKVHDKGKQWNIKYKLGKDLKIKGIDNLQGLPSLVFYKTNKIEAINANTKFIMISEVEESPFTKISVSSQHLEEANK